MAEINIPKFKYKPPTQEMLFQEIDKEIASALKNNYELRAERMSRPFCDTADEFVAYLDGKIAALRGIEDFINELKEKYTEGA